MANPVVLMETSSGSILIELFQDKAPVTVQNFLTYVDQGFYTNTVFHRVIKDFMIQGGGLTMKLEEKKTNPPIQNEAGNGLSNLKGTIAMARTSEPHSAAAQFFMKTVDNYELDYVNDSPANFGYCVFGQVIEGMDTVEKINKLKTRAVGTHEAVPVDSVVIVSVERFE